MDVISVADFNDEKKLSQSKAMQDRLSALIVTTKTNLINNYLSVSRKRFSNKL